MGSGGGTMCRPTQMLCEVGWKLCPNGAGAGGGGGCCPEDAECVSAGGEDKGGDGDGGTYVVGGRCKLPKGYRTCGYGAGDQEGDSGGWTECNQPGLEGVCCPGGWECSVDEGGCRKLGGEGEGGNVTETRTETEMGGGSATTTTTTTTMTVVRGTGVLTETVGLSSALSSGLVEPRPSGNGSGQIETPGNDGIILATPTPMHPSTSTSTSTLSSPDASSAAAAGGRGILVPLPVLAVWLLSTALAMAVMALMVGLVF